MAPEGRYIGPAGLGDGDFQVSCPILLRLARHYGKHGTPLELTQRNHHGMDWTALRWRAGNWAAPNLGLKRNTQRGTGEIWLGGRWRPRIAIDTGHRDNNGGRKHGNTLIRTLRKTYGPSFAADCNKLDETSLSQLIRDHEAGHLFHFIAPSEQTSRLTGYFI